MTVPESQAHEAEQTPATPRWELGAGRLWPLVDFGPWWCEPAALRATPDPGERGGRSAGGTAASAPCFSAGQGFGPRHRPGGAPHTPACCGACSRRRTQNPDPSGALVPRRSFPLRPGGNPREGPKKYYSGEIAGWKSQRLRTRCCVGPADSAAGSARGAVQALSCGVRAQGRTATPPHPRPSRAAAVLRSASQWTPSPVLNSLGVLGTYSARTQLWEEFGRCGHWPQCPSPWESGGVNDVPV
ncbi:uncharacterized protein LOC117062854 [Trachypithecus francoisi]|uniref:uncharacterized protein LOC117062854 n=1 Tax=Trachypithecus francoisi TaxID=54180 RepID=UPI00141AE026|nr:uncharacterized protein LOC117062854 [Trachypithecus francoisi]